MIVYTNAIDDLIAGDDYVLLFTCPSRAQRIYQKNFAKFN